MATFAAFTTPGYSFDNRPDLSRTEIRERLSQSAMDGFFAIAQAWKLDAATQGALLGGLSRSAVHKLRTAAGLRSHDELTRISLIVAVYKDLHILLDSDLADAWMTRPNRNPLFQGRTPLEYAIRFGIPGLENIRALLDAARGGQ